MMTTCTYTFANGDVVKGVPALKAYLVEHPELMEAKAERPQASAFYVESNLNLVPASVRDEVRLEIERFAASVPIDNEQLYYSRHGTMQDIVMMLLRRTGMNDGEGRQLKDRLLAPGMQFENVVGGSAAAQPQQSPADANQNAADQGADSAGKRRITDIGEKIGGARKDTATSTGSKRRTATEDDRPAWARRYQIAQIIGAMNAADKDKWVVSDTKRLDWKNQPTRVGKLFDTREDAEAAIPLIAVSAKHRVVSAGDKWEIWRDINDRKRVKVVAQQFDTRAEAMQYMAQNAVAIIETNTTFGEADLPKPENKQRIGAARRTGDVLDTDFKDTFGFRAIEFGNWNNQAERQEVMNEAYDGLLDLAEVMGIPPKAISLNGDLALAFGARGHGLTGARAHYEPAKSVINLTKMNGAGALAHEWFHALDHYLARQDGKAPAKWVVGKDGTRSLEVSQSSESNMASGGFSWRNSGVREAVRTAYKQVMDTIAYKAEKYVEDSAKAERFVSKAREDVKKDLDSLRRDLAEQKDPRYWKRNNKPASAEQLAEFDTIAELILSGQSLTTELRHIEGSKSKYNGMRWTNDALEQISAIYKAVRGRSGFTTEKTGPLDGLRMYMSHYSQRLKMLADAQQSSEKERKTPTSFAMSAKSLDQGRGTDYWATPHELAARAFQGYVEDKIAEHGGKSPFLNYGPANAVIATPWGWERPYPHGDERKAINAAFDNLVQVFETKETPQGVAMLSRASLPATIEVDGKMRPTTNNKGQPIHPAEAGIRNFWRWFGDSKVVDAEGRPLVVYHGTDKDFSTFSKDGVETLGFPDKQGFYFTADAEYAEAYGLTLMPAYLSLQNPYQAPLDGYEHTYISPARRVELEAQGFDSVIFDGNADRPSEIVAFRSEQVKSAVGNNGDFNPANPDIRYSTGNIGARGTPIAEVRALARQIQRSYANLPKVHVLASPADLPAEAAGLRAEIARQGAENDVEGAMFDGAIYLFADNLASLERAEFVLAEHEVAHLGLRGLFGDNLEPVLRQIAVRNPKVREAAREAQKRGKLSLTAAVEEVLADMPTAELAKLKGWRKFVQTARDWFAGKGFERIAAKLDSLLQGAISEQEAADLYVAEVVRAARDWVKGGKGEAGKGAALSRNAGVPNPAGDGSTGKAAGLERERESLRARLAEIAAKERDFFSTHKKSGNPRRDSLAARAAGIENPYPLTSRLAAINGELKEIRAPKPEQKSKPERIPDDELPAVPANHLRFIHGSFDGNLINDGNGGGGFGGVFTTPFGMPNSFGSGYYYYVDIPSDEVAVGDFRGKSQEEVLRAIKSAMGEKYDEMYAAEIWQAIAEDIDLTERKSLLYREDPREADRIASKVIGTGEFFAGNAVSEASWEAQRLRGEVARLLGFKAVRMRDETGLSALVVRGVQLKPAFRMSSQPSEFTTPNDSGADGIRLSRAPAAVIPSPAPLSPSQGALPVTVGQARQSAGWKALQPSLADSFVYELQNKQVDLKRTVEAIRAAVGKINEAYDAEQAEELYHARRAERIKDFLESEEKPLIEEMRMRGVSMPELEAYLWARTAKETNAHVASLENGMQDGGSGLTNQEVDDYYAGKDILDANGEVRVKGLDWSKRTRLDALAKRVDKIVKQNRQLLVDYQLESPETIKTWEQTYPHYVPLHRDGMENPLAGPGIGQGFSIKGSESKRRTGSAKDVVDILGNLMEQRARIISRGEKNRVAQSLYGLAKMNPNPEFWTTDRPAKEKVIERINGKDTVVERISPTWKNRAEVVVAKFLVNGKVEERAVVFEKRNPRALRMAEALKNLDADDLGHVLSVMAKGTRYFAAVNTQYNPIFGIINFLRDVQTGMLNLSSTPLNGHRRQILANLWPAVRGIASALRGNMSGDWAKLYEEFRLAGGVTGYTDMFATGSEHAKELQSLLTPTKWQSLSRSARENIVMRFLAGYNTTLENAVRLATYKAGLDNGLTPAKSASIAKNLTVNFNRKGRMATQVGAGYAFFNAAVQGMARMKETMFKDGRITTAGTKILAGGVMVGVGQALLLAAAGFGDDEPPEFVRERNLILPIGDGKYLTAPMPLGFHAIPNIGRVTTEWMLDGFRDPAKHFASLGGVFADAFNPLGSSTMLQTLSPTVLDPVVAIGENQDWTGKNIAKLDRDSLNPTPGHTRAKDTASFLAKSISYALNIASGGTEYKAGFVSPTPDQLDYLAGQLGGGVWRELSKLEQTATAAVTGEDLPAYKIPLVGRFYGDSTGKSGQSAAFYAAIERINGHELELKGLRKDGRGAEAREYLRDNPEAMLVSAANAAENQLSELRRMKRDLLERGAEKTKVREVEERMTELMARFNARVKSAEERRKSAVALQDE